MRCLLLAVLLTGCTHRVEVSIVEPAEIDLPGHVDNILVVNHSLPTSPGDALIAEREALSSGERLDGDLMASGLAVSALEEALRESDRYQVVSLPADQQALGEVAWDEPLTSRQIKRMCQKANCDAVISLTAFDSDASAALTGSRTDLDAPEYSARLDARVTAEWRAYDADGDEITAASRDLEQSQSEVRRDRPRDSEDLGVNAVVTQLAVRVGEDYAHRIVPAPVVHERAIYGGSHFRLRRGWRMVQADDWDRAANQWRKLRRSHDASLVAKARFNLAVYRERRGELSRALDLARLSAKRLPRGARYVRDIKSRMRDEQRLRASRR